MKIPSITFRKLTFSLLLLSVCLANAQTTAFTYQGRLNDGPSTAHGSYDLTFAIFNVESGAGQIGNAITNLDTAVSNGLFTVTLDFGASAFDGDARWLEIAVRPGDSVGAYTSLAPRQPLNATPYAVRAANFSGAVADNQLTANIARLNASAAFTEPVSFSNATGTFSGNASGLTNVPDNSLVRRMTNFSIVAWGWNGYGQTTVPTGLNNVAVVAAGAEHSLALKSDGTVVAWGRNHFGQTNVPAGLNNVAAVAVGGFHNLALKTNGTVVAWGYNFSGAATVPAGLNNVAAVAAGFEHSLALKTDGTIVAWGFNSEGVTNVPVGLNSVAAMAAGSYHNLALKSNGTVVAWGRPDEGQATVPAGLNNVAAVAAGRAHSLVLKSDGTVVAWGLNSRGQTNVPPGLNNVAAVAAGFYHSLALKSDGTVVVWGDNDFGHFGQTNVPAGLRNVIGIAAGPAAQHVLAIRKQPYSPMAWLDADNTFNGNIQVNGILSGNGSGLTGLTAAQIPSLDASKITSGTLADARLSANVALRSSGNSFTGNQTITGGNLGIGIAPQSTLDVNGTARIQGANNWGVSGNEGDFRVGNDSYRFKIGVANAGGGAGDIWMRAHGGIERVNLKAPGGTRILSNEAESSGVSLAPNGTAWGVISDRNLKKDFAAVNSVAVLEKLAALPITQWHYNWESTETTPHIGPMAQDFKAAFYPGTDDKSITTQEADGVALAAIQGLNQKLEAEVKAKDVRISELEKRLSAIESLLKK